MSLFTPEEIEAERQDKLTDVEHPENYAPEGFGWHEALHTSYVVMDMTEDHLLNHNAIVLDREAYDLAHAAFEALHDLYQYLGSKHA